MTESEPDSWDDSRGAEIYAEATRGGVLYRTLAGRLVDLLNPSPGGCWLDLAAGAGLGVEMLLARVGPTGRVVALDRAKAMLNVAMRAVPVAEAGFAIADPAALPLADRSLAGAMCSAAFWHFPAVGRVFADLARVLAPGGVFAFNVPAAQLSDVVDAAPAPLQLALAREGERRFGRPPAPGGPVLRRTDLLDRAAEAGLARRADGRVDVFAPQQELLDLLGTPAIGARLYPNSSGSERRTLIQAVAARVDLAEKVPLRWCEFLFQRA